MKRIAQLTAALAAMFALAATPIASADTVTCEVTGILVIVAITGPVTLTCGSPGTTINHTTNVNVAPSIQVDPHLFAPAPQGEGN